MLKELSNELRTSNNQILKKLFPYSFERLLSEKSTIELDKLFNQLLNKLKIECLIECGAHGAEMSKMFVKQGGKSIAIEANPLVFENITPKSEGNFKSFNVALSNSNNKLNFYIPTNNNKSGQSTFFPKDDIQYNKIEVETLQLDELLKIKNIENKNLALWIDVEGHQFEVLDGSSLSLQNTKLIKIEVESIELFKNQKWSCYDVDKFLNKNNFVAVFRDFEYDEQFNVLYVSKDFLDDVKLNINLSKRNLKNKISFKKVLVFLKNKQHFLSEMKRLVINLFGTKIGNYISKFFGSKTSHIYLENKTKLF